MSDSAKLGRRGLLKRVAAASAGAAMPVGVASQAAVPQGLASIIVKTQPAYQATAAITRYPAAILALFKKVLDQEDSLRNETDDSYDQRKEWDWEDETIPNASTVDTQKALKIHERIMQAADDDTIPGKEKHEDLGRLLEEYVNCFDNASHALGRIYYTRAVLQSQPDLLDKIVAAQALYPEAQASLTGFFGGDSFSNTVFTRVLAGFHHDNPSEVSEKNQEIAGIFEAVQIHLIESAEEFLEGLKRKEREIISTMETLFTKMHEIPAIVHALKTAGPVRIKITEEESRFSGGGKSRFSDEKAHFQPTVGALHLAALRNAVEHPFHLIAYHEHGSYQRGHDSPLFGLKLEAIIRKKNYRDSDSPPLYLPFCGRCAELSS